MKLRIPEPIHRKEHAEPKQDNAPLIREFLRKGGKIRKVK